MITRCRNCANQLVFDPGTQKLVCDRCGCSFKPEDFNISADDPVWDKQPVSMNDVLGTDSKEYMDCYVYTCSSCGGEVIINGKEVSTKCIYCGNSTVVFSRIARRRKPAYILPFKQSRETALEYVRDELKHGFFVPKQLKHFKAEDVRGIYIPYWLVNCKHHGAAVVKHKSYAGELYSTYYGKTGKMNIVNLPIEASKMFTDDSSVRLEPFGLQALKPFDEDYLLGFYSDIPDITYGELKNAVQKRADALFNEAAMDSEKESLSENEIFDERHSTAIDYQSLRCVMLPAWFITYDYEGKHNTILVNGQTGKVIGGIPWNKKWFILLFLATGILLSGISYFLKLWALLIYPVLGIILCAVVITLLSIGIATLRKICKSLELTQSGSMFNFVKKRQG